MKLKLVMFVIIVIVAAGLAFWRWQESKSPQPKEEAVKEIKAGGIGAQIFERAQNPLKERLPDTNPFSAPTNPFNATANPFKAEYKNPF